MTEIQRPPLAVVPNTPPPPAPRATVWQDNAHAFATTAETAIEQEMRSALAKVRHYRNEGMPGRAHYEIVRSVMRQARIAGISTAALPLPCPCGGRCHQ